MLIKPLRSKLLDLDRGFCPIEEERRKKERKANHPHGN